MEQKICIREINENLRRVQLGEPLTKSLLKLNENCEFKKKYKEIYGDFEMGMCDKSRKSYFKKICGNCFEEFFTNKKHQKYCNDCKKGYTDAYRKLITKNLKKAITKDYKKTYQKIYQKEYRQRPKNKLKQKEYIKIYHKKYYIPHPRKIKTTAEKNARKQEIKENQKKQHKSLLRVFYDYNDDKPLKIQ